ncbi:pseudouridine synthase family protein [Aliikangiella sp. IMCC44359]|uniref:pseudouridine synthase family protein n=1 Tax=Aliikangiella sp. IMCC44359 TaxID=3459125 RepID=UPI00403A8AE0
MKNDSLTFEAHWLIEKSEQLAIDSLFAHCPQVSKQQLKVAMRCGAVWLTRNTKTERLRRAKKVLCAGDQLHLYFNQKLLSQNIKPAVLIADEGAYSIWNKPSGMFSQGTKWGDHSSICRWIEMNELTERPTYLVHRLDRATSGLILVAHQKKIMRKLASMFENRLVNKHYRATVIGQFPKTLELSCINQEIDGKTAKTKVLNVQYEQQANLSHLLLKIETGRKHQIRKHLFGLGFSILGDRLYTQSDSKIIEHTNVNSLPDLQLQSCYLSFECPITQQLRVYDLISPKE